MLLKCIKTVGPFKAGETYDVAEILEDDWHVMARLPGETVWPKPGDHMFAWHADEVFEPIDRPIEIASCGYYYNDHVSDFYGVILDDPQDVNLIRKYRELDPLEGDEEFEEWNESVERKVRPGCEASMERAVKAFFEYLHDPDPRPDVAVFDDMMYPPEQKPFASVGFHAATMLRKNITGEVAAERIRALLQSLAITSPPIEIHDVAYWGGDGSPRLINPPAAEA